MTCTDNFPDHPSIQLHSSPQQTLYPPRSSNAESTSIPAPVQAPFSTINRFVIPLPVSTALPGSLNLTAYSRGEVKYELVVELVLSSGSTFEEFIKVEGTPLDLPPSLGLDPDSEEQRAQEDVPKEVEKSIERDGVRTRVLLDTARPRSGDLLRLGVEIKPIQNEKSAMDSIAGPSTRPSVVAILRPLRRVTVQLFRRVTLVSSPPDTIPNGDVQSSSSSSSPEETQHLSLVYASGKSMRYPGNSSTHPLLRLLFTIPTAQLPSSLDQTYGEITQSTPYHTISFFVRVVIGFGAVNEGSSNGAEARNWTAESEVVIRRKMWKEPAAVVIEMGEMPSLGEGENSSIGVEGMTEEQLELEAYRAKGRDVVGSSGTIRGDSGGPLTSGDELPPPFELPASQGPSSGTISRNDTSMDEDSAGPSGSNSRPELSDGTSLPSFLESEAQMRAGEAPFPSSAVPSQRLVPVNFDESDEGVDGATIIGRTGSLGGELGTWIEVSDACISLQSRALVMKSRHLCSGGRADT